MPGEQRIRENERAADPEETQEPFLSRGRPADVAPGADGYFGTFAFSFASLKMYHQG
jgi:hypothetical protein